MRTVRDIMEPKVIWIAEDAPLLRAAELLGSEQIGGVPACDPYGHVVGVISKTDLTDFYGGANEMRLVRDIMSTQILSVKPEDSIESAIRLMAFEGVHRLIVLDDLGHLEGIVTSMDILRELGGYPRRAPIVEAVAPPDK